MIQGTSYMPAPYGYMPHNPNAQLIGMQSPSMHYAQMPQDVYMAPPNKKNSLFKAFLLVSGAVATVVGVKSIVKNPEKAKGALDATAESGKKGIDFIQKKVKNAYDFVQPKVAKFFEDVKEGAKKLYNKIFKKAPQP